MESDTLRNNFCLDFLTWGQTVVCCQEQLCPCVLDYAPDTYYVSLLSEFTANPCPTPVGTNPPEGWTASCHRGHICRMKTLCAINLMQTKHKWHSSSSSARTCHCRNVIDRLSSCLQVVNCQTNQPPIPLLSFLVSGCRAAAEEERGRVLQGKQRLSNE